MVSAVLEPEALDTSENAHSIEATSSELHLLNQMIHDFGHSAKESDEQEQDLSFLSTKLIPRSYQKSLFLKAIEQNSIITLNTGAGKTLIAAMVIEFYGLKYIYLNKTRKEKGLPVLNKISIFLCNNSLLVEQQGEFLKASTRRLVTIHKSGGKHTRYSKDVWAHIFCLSEVHVMTHQLFLNCLRSAYISLDKVKLIVFDECHHSRKDSPYNRIMREFYDFLDPGDMPRMIGLTASPSNASEEEHLSVHKLERNLDSNLHIVDSNPELDNLQNTVKYDFIEYDLYLNKNDSLSTETLIDLLSGHAYLSKVSSTIKDAFVEYGAFGSSVVMASVHLVLKKILANKKQIEMIKMIAPSLVFQETKETSPFAQLPLDAFNKIFSLTEGIYNSLVESKYPDKPSKVDPVSEDLDPFALFSVNSNDNSFHPLIYSGSIAISPKPWKDVKAILHPKVNSFLNYLYKIKSGFSLDDGKLFKAIFFVRKRSTAYILSFILSSIVEFSFIKSEPCVSGRPFNSCYTSDMLKGFMNTINKNQNKKNTITLERFKKNEINVLIATQVAEEGLDVSECNLVIRFDPAITLTSFIQARGRARSQTPIFAAMVTKSPYKGYINDDNIFEVNGNSGILIKAEYKKENHCGYDHYEDLIRSELLLKNIHKHPELAAQEVEATKDANQAYGKLTDELINCPNDLEIFPKFISGMAIDASIELSKEKKDIIQHIATQISKAAAVGAISKMYFKVTETGALLTTQSSPSVLNEIIQRLRSPTLNSNVTSNYYEENTSKGYFYRVNLPKNSIISSITGPVAQVKKVAKRSVSFYACIVLYYYGFLNNNLESNLKEAYTLYYMSQNINPLCDKDTATDVGTLKS
ncbi:hypothetical protein BB560_003111 [Smittium megazygosporum]|uniref:Dicer-like protein 1 n=1 Tax=Smittium megazygosporum TaxID=133381 RepID=A0A2T9ZCV7_9FUNG|nr:hypothetical protein BB560_003111 [Smittium megazygosporum]